MGNKDDFWLDPSKRATEHLNMVLDTELPEEGGLVIVDKKLQEREKIPLSMVVPPNLVSEATEIKTGISVEDARNEAPIIEGYESRHSVRRLFITKDASIRQEGSVAYRRMTDIRELFLEIHIVVLNCRKKEEDIPVTRLFENIWLYPTNSSSWWSLGFDAYSVAEAQLVFSGGFRADIVVAEDLFESGLAGWFLSKKYERPFQLHITEDFFDASYVDTLEHPTLYEWSAKHLLKRVKSVRTKTEFQRQAVIEENDSLEPSTQLLPSYYDLQAWRDLSPTVNLREQYPQFKFIILNISSMHASSHAGDVMLGAAKILRRYPAIGLVMVGNGPLRTQLERQAIALGLHSQIEFTPMPTEVVSYMKSAHVFVQLSEDGAEDDLLLEAAVSKLPIIANANGLAGKLFVDNESACLCAPTDSECIADKINMYLNENQVRARFALNANETVFERIEQDYSAYLQAYGTSIERCLVEAS